ncbi:MAG: type II methionyl aminopeptidase [Methanomassiliicoccales archaeon]|jgi:methionyl aminopeptidase|nr:type II methionyl aminopeptidase [Methanomassiliicoccales archaeon]
MNEYALQCLKKAGAIAGEARQLGLDLIDEGVRYLDLAVEVEEFIKRRGAKPAFPVNISVNEVAAHYTPSSDDDKRFKEGDIVKIDVGAHIDGYIGDTAATVEIKTRKQEKLIRAADEALRIALDIVCDGVSVSMIGGAIERTIKGAGFRPVVNLTGHSMTRYNLHAGLSIPNIDDGIQAKIRNDMVLAIEPFATDGTGEVRSGKPGNIYRVLTERPIRDEKALEFFRQVHERFNSLPFCERWCHEIDRNASSMIRTLHRHGLISSYPVLNEIKGGIVSQAEHTIIVHDSKSEITTIIKGNL